MFDSYTKLVDETIVPSNVSFVSGDKDKVIKGDLKNVFNMDKQNSYRENFIFDVEMEITPNIFEDYFLLEIYTHIMAHCNTGFVLHSYTIKM